MDSDEVFSNVFDQTKSAELRIVADQIRRDMSVGTPMEQALTEAQFALGLGYGDVKIIEAFVKAAADGDEASDSMPKHDLVPHEGVEPELVEPSLDPEDPIDMHLIDFLKDAESAGVPRHDALKMLAARAEELAREELDGEDAAADAMHTGASLNPQAGLKSTLRKLRQQLNKHDNEDLDGMSKLISCIEGVEKQLEKKQKAKDERKSKKAPAESADEGEKEAEAAAPLGPGDLPDDPMAPADVLKPDPKVQEDPFETAAKVIDFERVKGTLKQLTGKIEEALDFDAAKAQNIADKATLMRWMEEANEARILLEYGEKKYSILRVQSPATPAHPDRAKVDEAFKAKLKEASDNLEEWAVKAMNVFKSIESSPAYQIPESQPAAYLKPTLTPNDFKMSPHNPAPKDHVTPEIPDIRIQPRKPKKSSLRLTAGMIDSIMDGFSEAVQQLSDLFAIADSQEAPAY